MKLIRYELEFEGEPQGLGFIQGLKDQGIKSKTIDNLISIFDKELKIPPYESFKRNEGEYIASYFTEEGISRFKSEINKIINYIKKKDNGFSIFKIEKEIEDSSLDILYKDEYQVLLSKKYIK